MFNPTQVYEELRGDSLSGRELEASLLVRAAAELNKCAQLWPERDSKHFQEKLDEALRFNQKLWTLLQMELSNPEHPAPEPLRKNLLRLSRYIDQRIFSLFAGGELGDLHMLSKINEELAAGLFAGAEGSITKESASSLAENGPTIDILA